MVTDEELIERVRSAMRLAAADVYPTPGVLDGIAPARGVKVPLPNLGGVIAGLAGASAVVIAVVAIILLGGHATVGVVPRPSSPLTGTSVRGTSLAQLRSELAILRRPQRAEDTIPAWGIAAEERPNCSNCLNVAKVIARDTRLLATIRLPSPNTGYGRGPEHIYLVLGTIPATWVRGPTSGWKQRGQAITALHLSLVGLTSDRSTYEQPMDELLDSIQTPMPAQALTPRDVIITSYATIGVVPDGVTRVKWELANPGQREAVTVFPTVRGNVARAPWTPAPRYTSLGNEQLLVGATWYGADGHVVASFSRSVAQVSKAYK